MAQDKKLTGRQPSKPQRNGEPLTDPRFTSFQTESIYRAPSNKKNRVTLDTRFTSILHDEEFSSKARVDRYGRKLRTSGKDGRRTTNPELARMYQVEVPSKAEEEEDDLESDAEVEEEELARVGSKIGEKGYDPARDGGFDESSSSEEEDSDSAGSDEGEEVDEDELEATTAGDEEGAEAVPEGEVSRRLAVVNLDWDHIRAVDLLAVFNSYASNSGGGDRVEKVTIYPSEFGKERMEREEMEGPPKELFASRKRASAAAAAAADDDDGTEVSSESDGSEQGESEEGEDDDEDEDEKIRKSLLKEDNGEEVSSTRLRKYQLERLRYYYAVVTCSSPTVAKSIYDNVDGREYLFSANFFDLRFIPDEMDFSEDKPRDECSRVTVGYKPNEFVTAALQHSKVKLTWDAEDTQRKEIQQRAFTGSRKDLDENELRAYLASDDSESDDEDNGVKIVDSAIGAISTTEVAPAVSSKLSKAELKRQQMRAKLGLSDEAPEPKAKNGPVGDMQITFTPGLSIAEKKSSVFQNEPVIDETTAERYIRKERERKARRKEKLKAERAAANGETDPAEEEQPEIVDQGFDDPFFNATQAEAEAIKEQQQADKKKQQRAKRAAEEKAAAEETAELEKILKSKSKDTGDKVKSNWSLVELEKAEKALSKSKMKKGKARLSKTQKAALEATANDDFEIDVEDKRFSALIDRPEFAVDPSHPRFRKTEATKNLLEETRKRKSRNFEDIENGDVRAGKKGRR